jgi:hypothetical protein
MAGFSSRKSPASTALLLAIVFGAILLPRWLTFDQAATADEMKWVARAANFSAALSSRDLAHTYQSEHPGVTTMWAGTISLKTFFPDYAAQNPGQMEPHELDSFLLSFGHTPLKALVAGRQVMVLFNALALTLVFVYAWRLLDLQTALLGAAFCAFSPFLIAHTQLMHLDGLAGSLIVLSLMAFLAHVVKPRRKLDLLVAGTAAGLAWLTKTPAFVLAPIVPVTTFLAIYVGSPHRISINGVRNLFASWLIWTAVGMLTFVLLWPVMWVSPISTLQRILQETLLYAGGGHGDPVFFNGVIYDEGNIPARIFYFYPLTFLWRSTPAILLGLALSIPALFRRWPPLNQRVARQAIFTLLAYTLFFTIFMTLGGKKFDRYLIPIYPALQLVAAAGWVGLVRWAAFSIKKQLGLFHSKNGALTAILLVLAAVWQFLSAGGVYPYPLSYYNPLLGGSRRAPQVMQIGWGEGLDAAGRYLSKKPDSRELTVASWYRSALAYYFDGDTISIKAELTPQEAEDIYSADYAVIYIHQWQRDLPADLLYEFANHVPEYAIEINGFEYARIYDLRP